MASSEEFNDPKGYTEGIFESPENFTCGKQTISRGMDYIAVAGSSEGGWKWNNYPRRASSGDRYMFINQAIRALYTFPEPLFCDQYPKIQRILIVFQFKYNEKDIELINQYAQDAKSRVIYVKNVDEFIDFLNKRKEKQRIIKAMEIYSHGIIDNISFHYSNDFFEDEREVDGLFNKGSVAKLDKTIFSKSGLITSYACRTGISIDKESFSEGENAGQKKSLAQYMADTLGITIKAYEKRTLYSGTYGNYEEIMSNQTNDPEITERKTAITKREKNEKNGAGPIMPKGAFSKPTVAQTPEGLKDDIQTYTPTQN